MYSVN
ncbi:hypothetical protein A2U01_0107354, partial [Trifolium medium]